MKFRIVKDLRSGYYNAEFYSEHSKRWKDVGMTPKCTKIGCKFALKILVNRIKNGATKVVEEFILEGVQEKLDGKGITDK